MDELIDRLEKAERELLTLGRTYTQATERQRVIGKAEGVRLALSYAREYLNIRTDDMTYQHSRRDEHSTLGDARDRYERDQDAFTAGVQYALDMMEGAASVSSLDIVHKWVNGHAESILDRVHTGAL